jgi:hypothetical protein
MKTCSKCRAEKPETEFYPRSAPQNGLRADCKACVRKETKVWRVANPEKAKASIRAWAKANPERRRELARIWYRAHTEIKRAYGQKNAARIKIKTQRWNKAHPDRKAVHTAKWARNNPEKRAATLAARNARKLQATPGWANQGYIEDVYRKAAIFTTRDGTPWHVDHIVPLKSKLVCGLHCEDNLQAILGVENITKGNRSWPDMPGAL